MKISNNGINLIKEFEGFSATPYLCSAKTATIGFGNTYYLDGTKVQLSDKPISKEQAENLLKLSLKDFEDGINENVKVPLTQNQFDALVCFAYNVGINVFKSSTLLKKINVEDFEGAANEFLRWNRAGGKVLTGLIKRREAENRLFLA